MMKEKIMYKDKQFFFNWLNVTSKDLYDDNKLYYYLDVLTTNYTKLGLRFFELEKGKTWTGQTETFYFKVSKIETEDELITLIDLGANL